MSNPLFYGVVQSLVGAAITNAYQGGATLTENVRTRFTLTAIGKSGTAISPVKYKCQAADPSGNWYDVASTNDVTGVLEVEHSVAVASGATVAHSCSLGSGFPYGVRCALVGTAAGAAGDSLSVSAQGF